MVVFNDPDSLIVFFPILKQWSFGTLQSDFKLLSGFLYLGGLEQKI